MKNVQNLLLLILVTIFSFNTFAGFGKKVKVQKAEIISAASGNYIYLYGKGFNRVHSIRISGEVIDQLESRDDKLVTFRVPKSVNAGTYELALHYKSKLFNYVEKMDITIGTTGPQGEAGENGEAGPRGPRGLPGKPGVKPEVIDELMLRMQELGEENAKLKALLYQWRSELKEKLPEITLEEVNF